MDQNQLGSYLKAKRLERKLSLRAAASAIGVDHMRLSDIERGTNRATGHPTRPSRALTERIAQAYGLPKDYLLDLAGYPRAQPELDDEAGLVLELFRSLDRHHQALAVSILRAMHEAVQRLSVHGESPES